MTNYQLSYLIGDLVALLVWILLFRCRKDNRREMLILSVVFGILSIVAAPVYSSDWWHPLTLTNTIVSFEDILFGFCTAGIAAVIYEDVFKKRVRPRKLSIKTVSNYNKKFLVFITFAVLLLLTCFFLSANSLIASIIAFPILIIYVWYKRPDLIVDSLGTGLLLTVVSILFFLVPEFITPGCIRALWYVDNLSGIFLFKAPVEDLIWFFLVGALIGPLWEYWQEAKLEPLQ